MRAQTIKLGAFIAMALVISISAAPAKGQLQVKTDTGTVEGKTQGSARAFLGIPYAAPPVGDLRWKAPQRAAAWTGVRKATEFGARCMQWNVYDDMVFRDSGPSEDCLTLNVWAPAKESKARLPVMVWIYGGGFQAGGTSEPRQDGAKLTEDGVVVVSMNYRLGIFGFFALPELIAESGHNSAGNYGLLDQVAALQWVKRNIGAFGGDPDNVTIFGESAGSFSVSQLMASPLAKGLFQKAIGESGANFSGKTPEYAALEDSAKQNAEYMKTHFGTDSVKDLRSLSADKILDEVKKPESQRRGLGIVIDGYFLPRPVQTIFAEGEQNDVPLLAGWNHDEGSFAVAFAKPPLTAASIKELGAKEFGPKADEFFKLYPIGDNATAVRSWLDYSGDSFIGFGTWQWLEAQATTGKKATYRYRFDLAPPEDPTRPDGRWAFHSCEIEYVFGTLEWRIPDKWRAEDKALSAQVRKYWTNFAKKGNPNGEGLPKWPEYRPKADALVMFLNAESKAGKDDQRARYLFLKTAWEK
ncbi:MAG: carboxylesterase family protein [Acidobacteria bacterium]|nr:carboxylesterase family protein [Acidobacteriota bacterium]MBS1865111.1 carboxylesterase family protein [Acidobacteriota bacterium]